MECHCQRGNSQPAPLIGSIELLHSVPMPTLLHSVPMPTQDRAPYSTSRSNRHRPERRSFEPRGTTPDACLGRLLDAERAMVAKPPVDASALSNIIVTVGLGDPRTNSASVAPAATELAIASGPPGRRNLPQMHGVQPLQLPYSRQHSCRLAPKLTSSSTSNTHNTAGRPSFASSRRMCRPINSALIRLAKV